MGGVNPAYDFVKRCLQAGKSVVTSNKELVAKKGAELLAIAQEKNANFLFEASVGGGIPIIRPMSQCLAANDVIEIAGILNGTTNFILTKMIREQMPFADALKMAQELGYAERNPKADIEGDDACRKICILASLAYGKHIYPDYVNTKGITEITLDDVLYADAWGGVVKLIGQVKKLADGKVDITVEPMFIERSSKGAGKLPTASAVVADIIDCVKHLSARKYLGWADGSESDVEPYANTIMSVYVRAESNNTKLAFEKATELFIGVKSLTRNGAKENEFAFTTGDMKESDIEKAIKALEDNGIKVLSKIRISDL